MVRRDSSTGGEILRRLLFAAPPRFRHAQFARNQPSFIADFLAMNFKLRDIRSIRRVGNLLDDYQEFAFEVLESSRRHAVNIVRIRD
jgi:hypothetical protein